MPFGDEVKAALEGIAPVYPDYAPPEAQLPFIVYSRQAQEYEYNTNSIALRTIAFTASVWAPSRDEATQLANDMEDALEAYRSADVTEMMLTSRVDVAAFPPHNEQVRGCEVSAFCKTRGK